MLETVYVGDNLDQKVMKIMVLLPTPWNCHHHKVTNITVANWASSNLFWNRTFVCFDQMLFESMPISQNKIEKLFDLVKNIHNSNIGSAIITD